MMDKVAEAVPKDALARTHISRRRFLCTAGAFGALAGLQRLTPAYARSSGPASTRWLSSQSPRAVADAIDLLIRETPIGFGSRSATATTINGTVPGPLLRFREGEDYVLRVTNELMEDTSIHWHGLIAA